MQGQERGKDEREEGFARTASERSKREGIRTTEGNGGERQTTKELNRKEKGKKRNGEEKKWDNLQKGNKWKERGRIGEGKVTLNRKEIGNENYRKIKDSP